MNSLTQTIATLTAQQKSLIRLLLTGASVIDAPPLHFDSLEQVERFLKLNQFNLTHRQDEDRLRTIHNEAVGYLENQLKLQLQPEIKTLNDIRRLFLFASETLPVMVNKPPPASSEQLPLHVQACSLLKIMHILFHIDGHELLYHCPTSRRELAKQVDDKMERELSRLKRAGFPIVTYQGGRKPKESLITKLLCKKTTIASRINDRLRYQIIVRERADLILLLAELLERIVPFNCIVPGTTINHLIDPKLFLSSHEAVSERARNVAHLVARSVSHLLTFPGTEANYSSENYRVLKFVFDMPIRLDPYATKIGEVHAEEFGSTVFSLVEIQIVDEASHVKNQQGDSAHDQYKARQKQGALRRMIGEGH